MNANPKCEPKNEYDYHKTFASQQNITTHHDMSHTCHMRHICMPGDQTIKPFGIAVLYILVQKHLTICSIKSKENIIFAHNFILKQNTNQASHCFDFHLCIFFLVKGLDT